MSAQQFSRWVQVRRAALGITQRQLAEMTGVAQPTIAAVESGKRGASAEARKAIETVLQVRPSVLLLAHADDVLDACEREGVTNVRVFGSCAKRTDRADSDIDLLAEFPPGADLADLLRLEEELERILTVSVDLVDDYGNVDGFLAPVREEALAL